MSYPEDSILWLSSQSFGFYILSVPLFCDVACVTQSWTLNNNLFLALSSAMNLCVNYYSLKKKMGLRKLKTKSGSSIVSVLKDSGLCSFRRCSSSPKDSFNDSLKIWRHVHIHTTTTTPNNKTKLKLKSQPEVSQIEKKTLFYSASLFIFSIGWLWRIYIRKRISSASNTHPIHKYPHRWEVIIFSLTRGCLMTQSNWHKKLTITDSVK